MSFFLILFFVFEGNNLTTYTLIGVAFIAFVGRRSLGSSHDIFSKAMLPCFFPGLVFSAFSVPPLFSSDWAFVAEVVLLVALSTWVLNFRSAKKDFTYRNLLKKSVFFIALQSMYGAGIMLIAPHYLEPLTWIGYPSGFKYDPKKIYPTTTGIQFFYDDWEVANRIEGSLPDVMKIIQTSPFFHKPERLVLVQKPANALIDVIRKYELCNILGGYNPANKKTYYFTDRSQGLNYPPLYESHSNADRAVITHEFAHQILSDYYGKWKTLFFIELWKNEGYAEYMATTGYYRNKSDLLAILEANAVSDEILQKPFWANSKKETELSFNDYIAAMVQTRYALDYKKISLLEFMKSSYKLASAQEIREWLMREDIEQ